MCLQKHTHTASIPQQTFHYKRSKQQAGAANSKDNAAPNIYLTELRALRSAVVASREKAERTSGRLLSLPLLHNCWAFADAACAASAAAGSDQQQMLQLLTVIYFCGSGSNSYNFCLASLYVLEWFIFGPPETAAQEEEYQWQRQWPWL